MAESAGAKLEALDATAAAEDDLPPDRPPTGAETAYLDERVADCEAAVAKIQAMVEGLRASLKTARRDLADARRCRDAGRDLPSVQRRRVA